MRFMFADRELDTERRELRRGPELITVEPQVLDLLIHLVRNHERVVDKDELLDRVWKGRIVSEASLTSRVYAARKAIGDTGRSQRLIRTIARRGHRFVGEVRRGVNGHDAAALAVPASDTRRPPVGQGPLHAPDRPSVAVLPFVNQSGDPEQEHLSDGISEDLTTALSRLRWFWVVARNSAFIYKGRSAPLKQVAEELGVGYVVEGSVRRSGDRMRVTAQLNDASTGGQIWAEHYDRSLADVFAVQDEITEAVVASIEPQLYAAEFLHAKRKPPDSLDAWELVMRAMAHYWRVTRQDNLAAQALLRRAVALDPDYGQAHGVLAASHVFGAYNGWEDFDAAVPVATQAAYAAVRADLKDPWAHLALGCVHFCARQGADARAEFELALRLNPSFSLAHGYLGLALTLGGEWRRGADAIEHALRLSPRDPFAAHYYRVAAYAQFVGRNYSEAMRLARLAVRLRADFAGGHRLLAAAAAMAGEMETAKAALCDLRRAHPGISLAWIASSLPIERENDRELYLEALRRAGLQ
jgi:TolB-like protein